MPCPCLHRDARALVGAYTVGATRTGHSKQPDRPFQSHRIATLEANRKKAVRRLTLLSPDCRTSIAVSYCVSVTYEHTIRGLRVRLCGRVSHCSLPPPSPLASVLLPLQALARCTVVNTSFESPSLLKMEFDKFLVTVA